MDGRRGQRHRKLLHRDRLAVDQLLAAGHPSNCFEGMMLKVSLADYSLYVKVYRELLALGTGPAKKEVVDIDL